MLSTMQAHFESIVAQSHASFAFREFRLKGFPFRWHFHPEYELTLIVSGEGRRFVGDHIGEFAAGDLVLLGRNLPHTWHSRENEFSAPARSQAICIQFADDFLGADFFARPELARARRLLKRSAVGLRFGERTHGLVARRMMAMCKVDPLGRLVELLGLLDLLARSRDVAELSTAGFAPSLRVEDRRRIDRVYRFLSEHSSRPIALDEAARLVHMSPTTFSRFFHRTSGKHFTAYVNELRVGSACRLLIETDRGIADIALEVGFGNLSNFNRRFLELKQTRPRDYRQHFRRELAAGTA
jgi:AraC-like DNA-binding protein